MKAKHFFIIAIVTLGMIIFSDLKAQSVIDSKDGASAFVQKFYDWYAAVDASYKPHQTPPFRVLINKRSGDLDAALRNSIVHYFNISLKNADMGLDFDPISAAQDTRSGFRTGNVKQAGDNFWVDVHDIKSPASKKAVLNAELILTVEVTKINGQWKIANFIYPPSNGGSDLLTILKNFAKDNDKNTKE